MSKAVSVRNRRSISVYPEPELMKTIGAAAMAENRSLGNMMEMIALRYFKSGPTPSLNRLAQALIDVFGEASEEQVKAVMAKLQ
jgi:hypothetical protein